jgi:hypothetical protein
MVHFTLDIMLTILVRHTNKDIKTPTVQLTSSRKYYDMFYPRILSGQLKDDVRYRHEVAGAWPG